MHLSDDFRSACARASVQIYNDIILKSSAATLCLENVSLVCRYRSALFGEDADKTGASLVANLNTADRLIRESADILFYGAFFDHSDQKQTVQDQYKIDLMRVADKAKASVDAVVALASSSELPDYFTKMQSVQDPVGAIKTNMSRLDVQARDLVTSSMKRLDQSELLLQRHDRIMKGRPDFVNEFIETGLKIETYRNLSVAEVTQARDFVMTLTPRPNPFF